MQESDEPNFSKITSNEISFYFTIGMDLAKSFLKKEEVPDVDLNNNNEGDVS